MTDKQQPEALRLANALEYCDASVARQAINELRRLHAELEALRAPHGQAPAQAAPAAVAGPIGYGPKVTVKRRCSDCKACNSESYAVQGDSGHYVYCEHPSLSERKYIGDTHWDTPDWCPAAAPTTTQPAPQQEALEQAGERVYAFRRKGLADFCTCDEARYEELSNKPNLFETRIFYTAPQPAPAPAEPDQYGVEFGMSGTHMHFKIGNQLFKLAYEPDEQEEFDFMKRMLVNAFTTFTHDVKTAPQPSPAAQGDAVRLERERICAAIKAEDDYCIDQGDYMLDSDDCIKIVRGEWVRPEYPVGAARAAQEGK